MHIRSLKHVIEVVRAMLHPDCIIVLGSSSLLASAPQMGEPGQPLELSLDADLLVEPCDAGRAGLVHEALGEGSLFHREYGVYVDLLRPNIVETFAEGWRGRCVELEPGAVCLSPLDVAFVKLCLGRKKDLDILKVLLATGILQMGDLRAVYQRTPMDEATLFKAGRQLQCLEKADNRPV